MSNIVRQFATETANGSGEVVLAFQAPPLGEAWCGTVAIPGADASAAGMVTVGGSLAGSVFGPGSYGPFTAYGNEVLAISVTGLTPGNQYTAVWTVDTQSPPTFPQPITGVTLVTGIVGTLPVSVVGPVTVEGTVDIGDQPVNVQGTVTADQGTPNAGGGQAWPVTP
jgi:hypothetical protein